MPDCTLAHDHVALPEAACATGCMVGIMLVSGLQKPGSGRARGGMQAAFHAPAPLRKGKMLVLNWGIGALSGIDFYCGSRSSGCMGAVRQVGAAKMESN